MNATPHILRLDIAGQPVEWLSWQEAVVASAQDRIAWTLGDVALHVRGGVNRKSGHQTIIQVSSIIALEGAISGRAPHIRGVVPRVDNSQLFYRDRNLCLYCGDRFETHQLTRDHVLPRSRGGADRWENVVAACKACNNRKQARTPEEAKMPLLAVPYKPTLAEWLVLSNRRVLADQMEFLRPRFSKHSRWAS